MKSLLIVTAILVSSSSFAETAQPTAPQTLPQTLHCTTDAFSGGADDVVEATVEFAGDIPAKVIMINAFTNAPVIVDVHDDDGGFKGGLFMMTDDDIKATGFDAAVSLHGENYILAVRGPHATDAFDVLNCK